MCLVRTDRWCLFFFITLTPRVELYTKSMRLKYEPASEPLHISVEEGLHVFGEDGDEFGEDGRVYMC